MKRIPRGTPVAFEQPDGKFRPLLILDYLSSGGQADVYTACDPKNRNELYCVKYLCGAFFAKNDVRGSAGKPRNGPCLPSAQDTRRKLTVLAKNRDMFPAPFVMPLGVSEVYDGGGLMYYMPYLKGYVKTSPIIISPDKYSARMKTELARAIAGAFRSLSERGYHYGDISDGNILYKFVGSEIDVKIIDAEGILPEGLPVATVEGTGYYRAPEVIAGAQPSIQSDVHAFSVLAFRMFMSKHPLETKECREMTPDSDSFLRFFCRDPRFIFSEDEKARVPAAVRKRWAALPTNLRLYFAANFSPKALTRQVDRLDYAEFLRLSAQ